MPQTKTSLGNTLDKQLKKSSKPGHGSKLEDIIVNKFGAAITKPAESSVTEQSDLAELLSRAELLDANFGSSGGPGALRLVGAEAADGILSKALRERRQREVEEERASLTIPRRPAWTRGETSASELEAKEREAFARWRESLLSLEARDGCVLTPYERNLDFWRQLWRVVERSDAVVQIVDARDPLFFYSADLADYAADSGCRHALICNKSDLLLPRQLRRWRRYFRSVGVRVLFFSAIVEDDDDDDDDDDGDDDGKEAEEEDDNDEDEVAHLVLSASRLSSALTRLAGGGDGDGQRTVGLVGYPNVGKSSTINSLLRCKKVPVSAAPGRTKHLQTVPLSDSLLLCDCPGLVMPQSVCSKADLIVSGVLPIDTMRDCVPPVQLLCERLPTRVLRRRYSLRLREGADARQVLAAYASQRGYMSSSGLPHLDRAAREILKDYVAGRGLVFCQPPPGVAVDEFNEQLLPATEMIEEEEEEEERRLAEPSEFDRKFFVEQEVGVGFKSRNPLETDQQQQQQQLLLTNC